MSSINLRLDTFIKKLDINPSRFERELGLGHATLTRAIADENKSIGSQILNKILQKYPELSAEWLMRGEGEMLINVDTNNINIGKNITNGHNLGVNGDITLHHKVEKEDIGSVNEEVVFLRKQLVEKDKQIGFLQGLLEKFK